MVIMGVLKYLMGYTLTVKRYALANYCPHNLSEFYMTARNKLRNAQNRPSIIIAGCRPRCV